jgi:hypothetical protein
MVQSPMTIVAAEGANKMAHLMVLYREINVLECQYMIELSSLLAQQSRSRACITIGVHCNISI